MRKSILFMMAYGTLTALLVSCTAQIRDSSVEHLQKPENGLSFGRAQEPADKVTLDGRWDIFFTDDPSVEPPFPKDGKVTSTDIEARKNSRGPNGWSGLNEPYLHAWYSRKITLPASWEGRRVFISFLPCLWEARVFLNGRPVGMNVGMLPFTLDVTAAARPGEENELLVIASGEVALLLDREKDLELLTPEERAEFRKLVPNGYYSPRLQGRWMWKVLNAYGMRLGIEGGWLWSDNPVYAADVFVKTSVREKSLTADVAVCNRSGREADVLVTARVLDAEGRPVLAIPGKQMRLADGNETVVSIASPWTTPRLWETDDPYMYTLLCEITDNGRIVSTHRTSFGFREFWSNGDQIILNGKQLHLRSDAIMYPNMDPAATVRFMRLRGMNCVRICWSDQPTQETMDYFDANGIVTSMETGLHSEMGSLNLARENPRFWKFFRNDMETMIRQYRNHPSINSWCFANEYRFRGESAANIEKVSAIKRHLQRYLDPTRSYWAADDYNLDFFDFRSIHGAPHSEYPCPGSIGSESAREMTLIPNGAYLWKTLPIINMGTTPWSEFRMPSDKPIVLDENAYLFFRMQSMDPLSVLFGDEAYSGSTLNAIEDSPAGSAFLHPKNVMAHRYRGTVGTWIFRANRWNDIANFSPHGYDLRGGPGDFRYQVYQPMYQDVMAERTFFLHTFANHFYDDEKVVLDVSVHNDTRQRRSFTLAWSAGATPLGERIYDLEPGMMKADALSVYENGTLATRRSVTITLRLLEDGKELKNMVHTVDIFPRSITKILPPSATFSVFDPPGALRRVLDAANIKYRTVADLEKLSVTEDTLFIGPDAMPDSMLAGRALVKYAEAGGLVIILRQKETPTWLPVRPPPIDSTTHSTMAFIHAPLHPAVAGLSADDFKFWRGDRTKMLDWNVVSLVNYLMPIAGNYLPIIAAGGEAGLFYSPLIEYPIGKGSILGCQLVLAEKQGREPVADLVLRNLIQYAGAPQGKPLAAAGIIPGDDKDGIALLRQTGVVLAPVESLSSATPDVVFVHATALSSMDGTIFRKAIEGGKTVFVYGLAKTETVAEIGARLNLPLVAEAAARSDLPLDKTPNWGAHELLQGVNDGMFFWATARMMQQSGTTAKESQNFFYDHSISDIVLVRAPGALIGRGERSVMAYIPIGAGKIILSTLRWDRALGPDAATRTQRLLSVLATNLGIRVKPTGSVLPLDPANAFQVDLRKIANMAFADEVANDGKGGWTDEGNVNDMRGMPLNMQYFSERMIPFDIIDPASNGGKSVLLLGYDRNPIPRNATIPVGHKATRLFFLHTAGWSGETARYVVRYEDGSIVEIPVINGVNVADWWSSAAAPGTMLVPVVNSYQMYEKGLMANPTVVKSTKYLTCFPWENPKPDAVVESITMKTEAKSTRFVLVAITGQIAADAPAGVSVFKMGETFTVQNASGLTLSAGNFSLSFGTEKSKPIYQVAPFITTLGKEYSALYATRKLGVTGELKDGMWKGVQQVEIDVKGGTAIPLKFTHEMTDAAGDRVNVIWTQPAELEKQNTHVSLAQIMYWDVDDGAASFTLPDGMGGCFRDVNEIYGQSIRASKDPAVPSFVLTAVNGDKVYLYLQPGTSYKFGTMKRKNPNQPLQSAVMYLYPPVNISSAKYNEPLTWWYKVNCKTANNR
ncbi:MAG: glycoside hydrolase family 2 TIM barrel-domain containing protein [Victivallales bacterium]